MTEISDRDGDSKSCGRIGFGKEDISLRRWRNEVRGRFCQKRDVRIIV